MGEIRSKYNYYEGGCIILPLQGNDAIHWDNPNELPPFFFFCPVAPWGECGPGHHGGDLPDAPVCALHLCYIRREAQWPPGICSPGCWLLPHPGTPLWGKQERREASCLRTLWPLDLSQLFNVFFCPAHGQT